MSQRPEPERARLGGLHRLLGVAVLNGVVVVSYLNQLVDEGRDLLDAVLTGAELLRPVLMTALVPAWV